MTQPVPLPFDLGQASALAAAVMRSTPFPMLATIDGDRPRLRPVSPVKTEGFTVYVANLRAYHKTLEIEANPRVELCYLSAEHDQVRIAGIARMVNERAVLEEIWRENPLLRNYLGSLDNPQLIVYRIEPLQVRFMREWALEYVDVPLTGAKIES